MDIWFSISLILAATSKGDDLPDWLGMTLLIMISPIGWIIISIIWSLISEALGSNGSSQKPNNNSANSSNHNNAAISQYGTSSAASTSATSSARLATQSFTYSFPSQMKKTTGLKSEVASLDDINLGDEQKRVFRMMNSTNDNLFITGKAGTGKSVLLQYFVRHTSKQVAVVAPTGVAALNVGG